MTGRKVLVCGGRDFDDRARLFGVLDEMHRDMPIGCIISGNARGADTLGEQWAKQNRVALMQFPANWDVMGNAAGKIRNTWMLDFGKPDCVVATDGGPGTRHMVTQARRAGVEVFRV